MSTEKNFEDFILRKANNLNELLKEAEKPEDRPSQSPTTKEEWWQLLDYYKDQLRWLVVEFHPLYRRARTDMKITAPNAEAACEQIRQEVAKQIVDDPLGCFDQFCEQRSDGVVYILNQVWFGVPESTDCWQLPGFGVLCDLCSESWCLETKD